MASRGVKTVEFSSNGAIIRARVYDRTEVLLDDALAEVEPGVEKTLPFDQWLATKPEVDQRAIRAEVEGEARSLAREAARDDREYAADRKLDEERDDRMTGGL